MSTMTSRSPEAAADADLTGIPFEDKPEGPISAAILAAGIGALTSAS